MRRALLAILCCAILNFVSCGSSNEDKFKGDPKWIGKSKQQLIEKYGLPNEKQDDGKGGNIFIYTKNLEAKVHGSKEKQGYQAKRFFYLDPSGTIYQFRDE
jgi:hypothetical protein